MRLTEPPPSAEAARGLDSFLATGRRFLDHFRTLGGLQPQEDVVDIGCGSGRMAIALTEYLGPEARYEGFDVVAERVQWCIEHITLEHPNFRFRTVDVANRAYRADGESAGDFTFPYAERSFDFAIATSLFTHLLRDEMERYVAEAARVIRPGGRLFSTWFALDGAATRRLWRRQRTDADPADPFGRRVFRRRLDKHTWIERPDQPTFAVGYRRRHIVRVLERAGLTPAGFVPGTWSGRPGGVDYQDIVVAVKH